MNLIKIEIFTNKLKKICTQYGLYFFIIFLLQIMSFEI